MAAMESFRMVFPDEFYRKFLKANIRPDGRNFDNQREVKVSCGLVGTAYGSSTVKFGNTLMVCAIRGHVANVPSSSHKPNSRHLCINLETPPLCSQHIRTHKPLEFTQFTSTILNKICQNLLDTKNLLFETQSGTYGWYLYADLYCFEHDGNILDVSLVALIAALKSVVLPSVKHQNGKFFLVEENFVKLNLLYHPICTSFGAFEGHVMVDPNLEEETLSNGRLHIVYDEKQILCDLIQMGPICTNDKTLISCLELAKTKTSQLLSLINNVIETHFRLSLTADTPQNTPHVVA